MPGGFASETAAATGKSKSTINQAIHRAENIEPDVMELGVPRTTIADWLINNDGSVNGDKPDHRKTVTP